MASTRLCFSIDCAWKIIVSVVEELNIEFGRGNNANIEELFPLDEAYHILETSPPAGWHSVSMAELLDPMLALGLY
jgi:hypothetical protein